MLRLTEIVYLAAPFHTPEERQFNLQVADLVRSYNFPLYLPQERPEQLHAEIGPQAAAEQLPAESMDMLARANLVIAIFYGQEFDTRTAFEVGYALGRRINVVAIQNELDPSRCMLPDPCRPAGPSHCARIVVTPQDPERFTDRLIPILNRYFEPHRPLTIDPKA